MRHQDPLLSLSRLQQQPQLPGPLTLASESRLAGSAGTTTSTVRVSTAITPTGIPPSLQGGAQMGRALGGRWVHPAPTDILQVSGEGTNGQDEGTQRTVLLSLWQGILLESKAAAQSTMHLTSWQAGKILLVPHIGHSHDRRGRGRPVQGLKQHCPPELSTMTTMFSTGAAQYSRQELHVAKSA